MGRQCMDGGPGQLADPAQEEQSHRRYQNNIFKCRACASQEPQLKELGASLSKSS